MLIASFSFKLLGNHLRQDFATSHTVISSKLLLYDTATCMTMNDLNELIVCFF